MKHQHVWKVSNSSEHLSINIKHNKCEKRQTYAYTLISLLLPPLPIIFSYHLLLSPLTTYHSYYHLLLSPLTRYHSYYHLLLLPLTTYHSYYHLLLPPLTTYHSNYHLLLPPLSAYHSYYHLLLSLTLYIPQLVPMRLCISHNSDPSYRLQRTRPANPPVSTHLH
jgi:hypothetical protein